MHVLGLGPRAGNLMFFPPCLVQPLGCKLSLCSAGGSSGLLLVQERPWGARAAGATLSSWIFWSKLRGKFPKAFEGLEKVF